MRGAQTPRETGLNGDDEMESIEDCVAPDCRGANFFDIDPDIDALSSFICRRICVLTFSAWARSPEGCWMSWRP